MTRDELRDKIFMTLYDSSATVADINELNMLMSWINEYAGYMVGLALVAEYEAREQNKRNI